MQTPACSLFNPYPNCYSGSKHCVLCVLWNGFIDFPLSHSIMLFNKIYIIIRVEPTGSVLYLITFLGNNPSVFDIN